MITISDLSKSFGSTKAVDNLNLEIQKGELFGLLGPNGAGKTTTLNILSTYIKPDTGSIFINDIDILKSPDKIKSNLGFIPQEISLYDELTIDENLDFWGKIYKMSGKNLKINKERVIKLVDLWDRRKTPVSKLSGGMKRRINIAAGILHNPQLLFMDEPTVGVDPQSRLFIYSMIEELSNSGKTIIYTTHYMEEAERLCSRIGIIDLGHIIALGSKEELIAKINGHNTINIYLDKPFIPNSQLDDLTIKTDKNNNTKLILESLHPGKDLSRLIGEIQSSNLEILNIESYKTGLEELFIKLTGRELRE